MRNFSKWFYGRILTVKEVRTQMYEVARCKDGGGYGALPEGFQILGGAHTHHTDQTKHSFL